MGIVHNKRLQAVILLWGGLLVLVFGGRMYTTDVLAQYEVAGSFVGQRPFMTVSGDFGWTVSGSRPGLFIPHGAGFSIILIPAAVAGQLAGLNAGKIVISLINLCASLALVGFWYACACRKYSKVSVGRFILIAVGSMALVYGKTTFDVTAAAAAAMAGFFFSMRGRMVTAGVCLGIAVLIRADSILLLPLYWRGWRESVKLLAGVVPFLIAILFLNWYRFGSPLMDGHEQDPAIALQPFRGGIPGLLLSPGKGLLYYAPLCILALFYQKGWRLWTPFVLSLVFHGMLHDWTGGTGWGPRFLFTAIPFLLMPLARDGTGGKLFWVVAAAGVLACVPAIWSNPSILEQSAGADLFSDPSRQAVIWTFSSSPLILALKNFGSGIPDIFGVSAAATAGISPWAGALAQSAAAAALLLAGVWRLKKTEVKTGDPS